MSPQTNQHQVVLQAGCPSCHPTNSVKALKGAVQETCTGNSLLASNNQLQQIDRGFPKQLSFTTLALTVDTVG